MMCGRQRGARDSVFSSRPSDLGDTHALADWLEVETLLASDGSTSDEHLKGLLRAHGWAPSEPALSLPVLDPLAAADVPVRIVRSEWSAHETRLLERHLELNGGTGGNGDEQDACVPRQPTNFDLDEMIESGAEATFGELTTRTRDAGVGYPFSVHNYLLRGPEEWADYTPYVFCLLVSYTTRHLNWALPTRPRSLFEEVCRQAAGNYLGGDAVRIGFPRDGITMPVRFRDAIGALVNMLGEGGAFKPTAPSRKDDGVDIVAWRHFPDRQCGKLILFGNCATGHDINDLRNNKCAQMRIDAFRDRWFVEPPVSPIVPAFFMPHRVSTNDWTWREMVRNGRQLLFDRCRVALFAQQSRGDWDEHAGWIAETLGLLGADRQP